MKSYNAETKLYSVKYKDGTYDSLTEAELCNGPVVKLTATRVAGASFMETLPYVDEISGAEALSQTF